MELNATHHQAKSVGFVEAAKWLSREWPAISWLVVLSIGLALSEGISVTLLIPALDSAAMTGLFAKIPVLRTLAAWLLEVPDSYRLMLIAGLLALAVTARGILQFGAQYLTAIIPLRLQCAIMARSYEALVDADLAYMRERNAGDLQVLLYDQPQRAAAVFNGLLSVLVSIATIVLFAVLMLLVAWQMTLAALVFVAVAHFIMKTVSGPWFAWAGERLTEVLSNLKSGLTETIAALVLIKLRSAETIMKRRFQETTKQYRHVEARRHLFTELQSPVLTTISGLFICCMLVLAMILYGAGDRSWTGLFILFILCLYRLLAPANRLIAAQGIIANNLNAFADTEAFITDAERSRLPNGAEPFTRLQALLRLEAASLIYEANRGAALDGVDLEVRRGEIIALVGISGAGKSSVLTLLMRLRDPSSGRVVVDDIDLRNYDVTTWRRRVSIVSQDIVLFNDSVRNNLCFGLQDVPDATLWAALRDASAEEFVRDLPEGLDTQLGDLGRKLSGGQRQRLALARALVADPDLLILDEATSQLDSITEASIQHTIDVARGRRSVLIVAHRLSTVRNADRIYVLDQGRVVEQGTHAELQATGGQYRRFFELQTIGLVPDVPS